MPEYINQPKDMDPFELFEYSVRKAISLGLMGKDNVHKVWANRIFDYERNDVVRSELMSIVKREYSQYFSADFSKYSFLENKIRVNFPNLFGLDDNVDLFKKMIQALEAEYHEQKNPKNRKSYKILSITILSSQNEQYIFSADLKVEFGDDPHFYEGMPVEVRSYGVGFQCEVIDYDYVKATLFFSCKNGVPISSDAKVISDASMNTRALQNLLQEISANPIEDTMPIYKFLNNATDRLKRIECCDYPKYLEAMFAADKSQYDAFRAALSNDITFIWGPPGTGKSYTLAGIIMALYYSMGERTAVCCLSNVAVDQLANKVVDIIEMQEPEMRVGEFYRAGRTLDLNLLNKDFLFPDDEEARSVRRRIKLLSSKVEKYRERGEQYSDEAIKVKAQLKDFREKLKLHTDYLVSQVKVVFSTISNFVLNPRLKNGKFDNLIVDEASMLAEPQLVALANNVSKRIILVGDFQQLSPISESGVPILKESVFKLCGIDINHTNHPALHQLLNQRRSNPKLVDVINHTFYGDKLNAMNGKHHSVVARAPYGSCVIGMMSVPSGEVRFTKGGTRQNTANADAVISLLDKYSEEKTETFSIGVITPYTGQSALLKARFIEKRYSVDFQDRVKIGTVHTFQGSECDVIIFDMVDSSKFENEKAAYFGKIYAGEQGEQLLNVAISRARHKLIVVCDPDFLRDSPGGKITNKSYEIFKSLLKARLTKP